MTTQSPPSANEQPAHRPRTKREQVLVACKVCRGRKTKCSGERPRCHQCEMRDQVCEWEQLSDEAPKAAQKRKYLDLELRSASEHELLTYLRTLSETDSLRLTRRLREGFHVDQLLNFARELSTVSAGERRPLAFAQRTAIEQHDPPHGVLPRIGRESESDQMVGETPSYARPTLTLPPIASIWYYTTPNLVRPSCCCIEPGVDIESLGSYQSTPLVSSVQKSHLEQICHYQIAKKTEKAAKNEREHLQQAMDWHENDAFAHALIFIFDKPCSRFKAYWIYESATGPHRCLLAACLLYTKGNGDNLDGNLVIRATGARIEIPVDIADKTGYEPIVSTLQILWVHAYLAWNLPRNTIEKMSCSRCALAIVLPDSSVSISQDLVEVQYRFTQHDRGLGAVCFVRPFMRSMRDAILRP